MDISRFVRLSGAWVFAFAFVFLFALFGEVSFAASVSIDCSGSRTIEEGVDFNSGDDLTLTTGGTCWLSVDQDETGADSYTSLNSLTVNSGVTLTHAETTSALGANHHYELDLHVATTVQIDGSVAVDGRGYEKKYTVGNTTTGASADASGGSHGGKGAKPGTSYALASDYDSIVDPVYPGGGGGGNSGGDGGGVIRITAGTSITVNGDITANGSANGGSYNGGGAGGTVYLNAGTINLSAGKTVSANGGNTSYNNYDGAGGGGRIALYYTTLNDAGASVQAYGGNGLGTYFDGAAGTIYHSHGGVSDLYIDSGTTVDSMHYATEIDSSVDGAFTNVYLVNKGRLLLESDASDFVVSGEIEVPTGTYFEAAVAMPTSGGGGSYQIGSSAFSLEGGTAQFYGDLTLTSFDSDANGGTGTLITNGNTYISSGSVVVGNGLTWEANSSTIKTDAGTDLVNITVKSGGTLTTSPTRPGEYATGSQFDRVFVMDLNLSGTLLVETGGSLNVDEKGYLGAHQPISFYEDGLYYQNISDSSDHGYTYGNTRTGGSYYTGGSHGGRGGHTGYNISDPYDSIEEPSYPGGGGGGDNPGAPGGTGGGAVKIVANTITLNESLTANGEDISGDYAGAGAGGTVYLNASTITLAAGKVISATGGNSTRNNNDNGGGGGRIAILYTTFNNNGDVLAHAGSATPVNGDGAAGTLFLHDQSDTYGDLYIENCATCSAPKYNTTLLTTIPTADQHAGSNNGYVFKSLTVSQYGLLNIPSGLDANGTGAADPNRKFFCNDCVNNGNGSSNLNGDASDGEVIYNSEAFGVYTDYTCVGTNSSPSASINSVVQRTDGSGTVDISVDFSDSDTGDTLTAKVEYSSGAGCAGGSDPTLSTSNVTGTEGTPSVDNAQAYQVRNITVAGGTNTVTFDWSSATDLPNGDDTYCVKITPNDGTTDGSAVTQTFTLDNVDPTGLTALTVDGKTTLSILLGWSATTETNFSHYEIWHGSSQVEVQGRSGSAVEWDDSDDSDLATRTTTDTTVTGLTPNLANYFKIWAIDTYGNEETVSDVLTYTYANVPGAPTVTAAGSTSLNVIIDENSNPSITAYAIKVGSLYVQADGTLGASEVWQTYSTWGGASGVDVTGLSSNTQYSVSVKARNGDSDETSLSTATDKYTFASAVTATSGSCFVDTSTENQYGGNLYWTDNGQSGMKIELDGGSGYSTLYDNATTNATSPYFINVSPGTTYTVRFGSYNADGILNTSSYGTCNSISVAYSSSDPNNPSGGGSGTASFFSTLRGPSIADTKEKSTEEEKKAEEKKKTEEEKKAEDENKTEEEKKAEDEMGAEEKVSTEPSPRLTYFTKLPDLYGLKKVKPITVSDNLADKLRLKTFNSLELQKSLDDYFADERLKKELFSDLFADLTEQPTDLQPTKGTEEYDLTEATDEVVEEITGDDTEAGNAEEPTTEEQANGEQATEEPAAEEPTAEEPTTEEQANGEQATEEPTSEQRAPEKVLQEYTPEQIVTAGVTDVVDKSVTNSVRKAIEKKGKVKVHTDRGDFIVKDPEDVAKVVAKYDEKELSKMDLDGDGISDAYALSKGVPLFNPDPDGDGITTSDEIYCGLDPLNPDSSPLDTTKISNLKGMTTGGVPAIRACGEEGSSVDVVLFNLDDIAGDESITSGDELADKLGEAVALSKGQYVGSMVMDEANHGVLLPQNKLKDGKYIVMLTDDEGIEHLSTLKVKNDDVPLPAALEINTKSLKLSFLIGNTLYLADVSDAAFDAKSYLSSFPGASIPVISGQVKDFKSLTVVATWNSRILSSTVLADATEGSFELEIPNDLPSGSHNILVYLQDENNNLVSSATALTFVK